MIDIMTRIRNMAGAISNLPPLAPKQAPFKPWFRMQPGGLNTPRGVLLQEASLPLVQAYSGWHEMRTDVVQATRIPGLYIEGLDLTAMGGEPYSIWN